MLTLTALAGLFLAGCGMNPGTSSSAVGADAGPWPQGPNRTTALQRPAADQVPMVPLLVVLRAHSAKGEELRLDVGEVALKQADQWYTVTTRADMVRLQALPLVVPEQGTSALLAHTQIPRRKYSYVRVQLQDKSTAVVRGEVTLPLTVLETTKGLGDWTPDEKTPNVLTVTLDGTKVATTPDSANLPAEAMTVSRVLPNGGVSGKLTPALPGAEVKAFWGKSDVVLGSALPDARTGAFSIAHLPTGNYRLEFRTPGYRPVDPVKNPLVVKDKVILLDSLALTHDTTGQ